MKSVVMSIGIPGSGKTTVMRSLAERHKLAYICLDDIRAELTGSIENHSRDSEAWELARTRLAAAIAAGKSVAIDATFTNPHTRREFATFVCIQNPDTLFALVFDIPFKVAQERNSSRERVVSDEQLQMRHAHLRENAPSLEDGFDHIYTIEELAVLEAALDSNP